MHVDVAKIAPANGSISILAVDDDPLILDILQRMLARLGYHNVSCSSSGQSALERMELAEASPEVILCDLNMPEMDGVEFIRRLVDRRFQGSLILISGEGERVLEAVERLARAHSIRVLGRLLKPPSLNQLGSLLSAASPQPRPVAPAPAERTPAEVRAAIAAHEMIIHYQPQVHVATRRVVGVEALVRWSHPQDGLLMPGDFIRVAEEHGLIDALSVEVVALSLAQLKTWQARGWSLKVAINISMATLVSLDFPDLLAKQVAAAGVSPGAITVEVTESRILGDVRAPLEVLSRLRLKGFRSSIDDFGTGHSSLVQLRDLPFDELKIDQTFVHGARASKTVRSIYDACIALAKELKMDVVAEGVEDEHDWALVRRTGCAFAQGYFIGRPMGPAALVNWVQAWHQRYDLDARV